MQQADSDALAKQHACAAVARAQMVQDLCSNGLQDERVIHAMLTVPRHCFVDGVFFEQAYQDVTLPIGLGQTISRPSVVARMVELLLAAPLMQTCPPHARMARILEIGSGCGYQAAVLAHVAHEVVSVERLALLHEKAHVQLQPFQLPNVHLVLADGMLGFAPAAPYAGIIAAAGGDAIPQQWIEQLLPGGRIVAPTVPMGYTEQALVVLDKTDTAVEYSVLEATHFVPLKSGVV